MKKTRKNEESAVKARAKTNIVLLDPDVFAAFPNSEAVNRALRAILDVVPARRPKRRRENS
jgi:hypothetical protein